MRGMHLCVPVRMYSHMLNKKGNVNIVSRSECHVLSNGALVFGGKSNIMYRQIEETIHRSRTCVKIAFFSI